MTRYDKPDYWALKAREEGYPARSVYKLKELDEKFGLFAGHRRGTSAGPVYGRPAVRVLDLGAAPGSWSLYTLRVLGAEGTLTAVDLSPLSRQHDRGLFGGDNFCFIQGDITLEETCAAIRSRGPFRILLSDAAPPTTGNRQVDTFRSLALAESALDYAEHTVEKGGSLVVKVFQGGDTAALLSRIRSLFRNAKSFKPRSCRPGSFETYYVGLERR